MKALSVDTVVQKRYFALSSVLSVVADTMVFVLLLKAAFIKRRSLRIFCAAALARAVSSALNYQLNSRYAFRRGSGRTAARYYILCALRLCCSEGILSVFACGMDLPAVPVKLVGDALLGIGSFRIQSIAVFNPSDGDSRFYGFFARHGQTVLRLLSRRYECRVRPDDEPVVYVCRHLNMHGPYTTLKWLTFDVHPLVLAAFFDRQTGYEHMRNYTFSGRWGKRPLRFSLLSWIASLGAYLSVTSLKGVPTYRNSAHAISTLRTGLRYLKKGESLIVFPDIDYTGSYGKESNIYEGFLYYGEMYRKSTGKELRFVPLYIDDVSRVITAGEPVVVSSRDQVDSAARQLKAAINGRDAA